MKTRTKTKATTTWRSLVLLFACALTLAAPRWSQDKGKDGGGGRVRVCIYRIAPGKHLDFLKWMAMREEVAKEAGVPLADIYTHLDGDAWDFVAIGPATTPEQDKKMDEIAARKGWKTGFPAALEFRQFLAWHTDTFAVGPMTAAELVAQAAK